MPKIFFTLTTCKFHIQDIHSLFSEKLHLQLEKFQLVLSQNHAVKILRPIVIIIILLQSGAPRKHRSAILKSVEQAMVASRAAPTSAADRQSL